MEFELIEHTADLGLRAWGKDLKDAFAAASRGLFSIITDLGEIKEKVCQPVEVTASDQEGLLVAWLNKLIYLFDAQGLVFCRFDITELEPQRLQALVYGEKVDRSRHPLKLGVKAATYHMLSIKRNNGYQLQVLLDI